MKERKRETMKRQKFIGRDVENKRNENTNKET
jgi:hypothetical protein